ncbi:MAG: septum formation family protein [Gordonia sp. (in: high G+C Gram-positive bacteria)]|uniref:septum formation family protein n=1 Tax=Gordonia sp. (in: high G+C Gram-positive bacteria) TaxID=84139 RepID=UPI0039E2958F
MSASDVDSPDPAEDPADAAPAPRVGAVRLVSVLVAVLVGAVVAGAVIAARGGYSETGGLDETVIGEGSSYAETDFTRSRSGDCLNWNDDDPGAPVKVPCTAPHRFEVAGTVDTAQFPGSEFGAAAPIPTAERFAEIRDEQCSVIVDRYLGGGLDPQGRLSVGLMYPSKTQWERGARVLRCGIEQPGPKGVHQEFAGRAVDSDQSFAWPDGTCIGYAEETRKPTTEPVNCAEPHAFQTTGTVDLSQRFGARDSNRPWPAAEEQNRYLRTLCPNQTNRFFGGPQKFRSTTLNVQWSVISEVSWNAGSRRVVCYVALPDRGGFAKLVGDARQQVLINGKIPVPPAQGPPGRALPTPVPVAPGYSPNDQEAPAPAG